MAPDWVPIRLGDAAEVVMGNSPPSESYNEAARGMPLLNGPTEFGARFPTPAQWTEVVTRIAEPGDILFCVRGSTTGRQNIADQRYCIGRGLAAVRGRSGISETVYLQYVLQQLTEDVLIEARGAGSTFPNISKERLEDRVLWLPPLPKQRKIAAILSSVDDSIEKTQAIIDQTEVVKKGLLGELTARGMPGMHPVSQATALGLLPNTWQVAQLANVANVFDPNPSHRYPEQVKDGIPLVSTESFDGSDGYAIERCSRISVAAYEEQLARCRFEPHDVVFARKGRIGFARFYGAEKKAFSHTVVTVKVTSGLLRTSFLLWIVRSPLFMQQLERTMNSNSGVPTLGVKVIANALVPLPPLNEQEAIAEGLSSISARIETDMQTLCALRRIKEALLTALLTGAIQVPGSTAEAA